ncbi:concanavalin A-like lectin/glucanase domain-containing protein [Phyllosticta capitalensis]
MHSLKLLVIHLLFFVVSSTASPFELIRRSTENQLEPRQNSPGKKRHCSEKEKNDYEVIPNTDYIVFNMMYNKDQIRGSVCTIYKGLQGNTLQWGSEWNMPKATNPDTVKGYSFIGLTIEGREHQLSQITGIPATYTWNFNTQDFKGNVVFDFMTGPKKGDSKTPGQAQELMLWLTWRNNQVPIGFAAGKKATLNIYGKTWSMYQGKNKDTGITVTSLLADQQYSGSFSGNMKDWLLALANQAKLFPPDTTWLNVANCGVEPFWGVVNMDLSIDMKVNA